MVCLDILIRREGAGRGRPEMERVLRDKTREKIFSAFRLLEQKFCGVCQSWPLIHSNESCASGSGSHHDVIDLVADFLDLNFERIQLVICSGLQMQMCRNGSQAFQTEYRRNLN